MEAYRDEKNIRVLEKINDLTVDLPMFVRRFANEYLVTKNKAPRTVLGYVGDIKVFFEFLEKTQGIPVMRITIDTLGSLTADDIQDYMMYLMRYNRTDPNNNKTIKETNEAPARARKLSSLRALYRYLIAHNHLEKNVAELVDMPKIQEKSITYLEKDEVRDVRTSRRGDRRLTHKGAVQLCQSLPDAGRRDPHSPAQHRHPCQ